MLSKCFYRTVNRNTKKLPLKLLANFLIWQLTRDSRQRSGYEVTHTYHAEENVHFPCKLTCIKAENELRICFKCLSWFCNIWQGTTTEPKAFKAKSSTREGRGKIIFKICILFSRKVTLNFNLPNKFKRCFTFWC